MVDIQNEMEDETEENGSEIDNDMKAIEAAPGPRKRGRKKGVKVGPRPTVWSCAAIVNDALVMEDFQAPEGSSFEELEKFSADDARAIFADLHDVETDDIEVKGPYHAKKGGGYNPSPKKRETVSVTLPTLTMKHDSAIYKGWKGMAYAIEGRDDIAYFMFGSQVNPGSDKKKNPPTAKTVLKTALEFENTNPS